MSAIEHALEHAAAGFRVFPIAPNERTPAHKGWQSEATRDPERIREWFTRNPRMNYGIYCVDGLLVLDVDVKNGKRGFETLAALEAANEALPETWQVRTPSGGAHFYFKVAQEPAWLTNSASKLGEGLDIRAGGKGYVIAPGSEVDGLRYEVLHDAPIAPCPDWLLALLAPKPKKKNTTLPSVAPSTAKADRYASRALESAVAAVAMAAEGGRNEALNREAHGLFRLAGAGRLDPAKVEDAMRRSALAAGLEPGEVEATLQSARAGLQAPNTEGMPARNSQHSQDSNSQGPKLTFLESAPEPLRRSPDPAKPYPVDALGELLGGAARSIHRVVQSPLPLACCSVLAAASLAAQSQASVRIDGRVIPLSLWLLTVADSGERKSATDEPALSAVREFERECMDAYTAAMVAFSAELHAFELAKKALERSAMKKGANREGLTRELLAIGPPPVGPAEPLMIGSEPNLEGLQRMMLRGANSLGIFSSEGGGFFGGHGMNPENVRRNAAGLCRFWDDGTGDRIRAGDGATKFRGRFVALFLQLQPVIASQVLSDEILSKQGFLARCLIGWPEGTAGTREYREESLTDDAAMRAYHAAMGRLLRQPRPLREGSRDELEPRPLTLDEQAKRVWIAIHDSIERDMGPRGALATVKPWASKAAEQILRVAGVLAVIEGAGRVTAALVERAELIVRWHLSEIVRLQGTATTPREVLAAETVLEWCWEHNLDTVHTSLLLRNGPPCVRQSEGVRQVFKVLEEHRWAERVEGGQFIDGAHRRKVWRVRERSGDV